jgi:hypothetical protein
VNAVHSIIDRVTEVCYCFSNIATDNQLTVNRVTTDYSHISNVTVVQPIIHKENRVYFSNNATAIQLIIDSVLQFILTFQIT